MAKRPEDMTDAELEEEVRKETGLVEDVTDLVDEVVRRRLARKAAPPPRSPSRPSFRN
jgi:hypothetical protein